jgi:hypothetical protein
MTIEQVSQLPVGALLSLPDTVFDEATNEFPKRDASGKPIMVRRCWIVDGQLPEEEIIILNLRGSSGDPDVMLWGDCASVFERIA